MGLATAAMATLPIASFFLTRYLYLSTNTTTMTSSIASNPDTWAGGVAILVTNIIIAAYCISAFLGKEINDDEQNNSSKDKEGPRVGIYKQRTD